MTAHFYIRLMSDKASAASFVVRLPQPIDLEGQWEVCLSEISLPGRWSNVTSDKYWFRLNNYLFRIPDGSYNSVYKILQAMGILINNIYAIRRNWPTATVLERADARWLEALREYDDWILIQNTRHVLIYTSPSYVHSITFSPALIDTLGLKKGVSTYSCPQSIENWRPPSLPPPITAAHVHLNILRPVIVGQSKVKLLRAVFPNGSPNEATCVTYDSPIYIPVQKKHFQSIEVNITDDTGQPISFGDKTNTSLLLHFREACLIST